MPRQTAAQDPFPSQERRRPPHAAARTPRTKTVDHVHPRNDRPRRAPAPRGGAGGQCARVRLPGRHLPSGDPLSICDSQVSSALPLHRAAPLRRGHGPAAGARRLARLRRRVAGLDRDAPAGASAPRARAASFSNRVEMGRVRSLVRRPAGVAGQDSLAARRPGPGLCPLAAGQGGGGHRGRRRGGALAPPAGPERRHARASRWMRGVD